MNSSTILLAIVACISLGGCSQQPVDGSGAAISKPVNHAITPSKPIDKKVLDKKVLDPKKLDVSVEIVAPDMIQKISPPLEDHKAL